MGSRLIAFPARGHQTVLVEVDDPNIGNMPVARGVAERAQETFETEIVQIRRGVEAMIAKTSVEGNVQVTLTWKPE
ncbi:MAG TPA: hypothetical protein VGI78_01395 [Acetobacteraceae bacterium]|jgi:hypothetical protein